MPVYCRNKYQKDNYIKYIKNSKIICGKIINVHLDDIEPYYTIEIPYIYTGTKISYLPGELREIQVSESNICKI